MIHYAINSANRRIYIEQATDTDEYRCENCGARLVPKTGEIRAHHFAHKFDVNPSPKQVACRDYSEKRGTEHELSEWHRSWQQKFPEESRERYFTNEDNEIHRADIYIETSKTVVEFQHSPLKAAEFHKRNFFYNSLGFNVVWLYDFDSIVSNHLVYINPKRASSFEKEKLSSPYYDSLYYLDSRCYNNLFGTWLPQTEKFKSEELKQVTVFILHSQGTCTFLQQMQMVPDNDNTKKALFVTNSSENLFIEAVMQPQKYLTRTNRSQPQKSHVARDGEYLHNGQKFHYSAYIDIDGYYADSISNSIKHSCTSEDNAFFHTIESIGIYRIIHDKYNTEYVLEISSCTIVNNAYANAIKQSLNEIVRQHVSLLAFSELLLQ